MLVLGFDTSTPAVTVALLDVSSGGSRVVAARLEVAANRQGELLAPFIGEVLGEAGAAPGDLAAIGVGVGPGPFTGLRVGVVTAKSMAAALDIPVYGECSLDVVAERLSGWAASADQHYAVMTDARRKQVYWATYDGTAARLSGPDISPPGDLALSLAGRVRFAGGAGAVLYRDLLGEVLEVVAEAEYPSAVTVAERAGRRLGTGEPADDPVPMYLRRPDARPPGKPKQVTPA